MLAPNLLSLEDIQQLLAAHPVARRIPTYNAHVWAALLSGPLRTAAAIHHAGLTDRPLKVMILATKDVVSFDDWRLLALTNVFLGTSHRIQFSVLAIDSTPPNYRTEAQGIAASLPEVRSRSVGDPTEASAHIARFQPDLILVGATLFLGQHHASPVDKVLVDVSTTIPIYLASLRVPHPLAAAFAAESARLQAEVVPIAAIDQAEVQIYEETACLVLARLFPAENGWGEAGANAEMVQRLVRWLYPAHKIGTISYRAVDILPHLERPAFTLRIDGSALVDLDTGHIYQRLFDAPISEPTRYVAAAKWLDALPDPDEDQHRDRDNLTPHIRQLIHSVDKLVARHRKDVDASRDRAAALLSEMGIVKEAICPKIEYTDERAHRYAALNGGVLLDRLHADGFSCAKHRHSDGVTPLMVAASVGSTRALEVLLDMRINVRARDLQGWTALHYAAANGHEECFDLLAEAARDISTEHVTPSDITVNELLERVLLLSERLDEADVFTDDGLAYILSNDEFEDFKAFGPLEDPFGDFDDHDEIDPVDESLLDQLLSGDDGADQPHAPIADRAAPPPDDTPAVLSFPTSTIADHSGESSPPLITPTDAKPGRQKPRPSPRSTSVRPILATQGALGRNQDGLSPPGRLLKARDAIARWLAAMRTPFHVDPLSDQWDASAPIGHVLAQGNDHIWAMRFDNVSDPSATWRTEIVLAVVGETTACGIRLLHVGAEDDTQFVVSIPRVVRAIVDACGWTQDGLPALDTHQTVTSPIGLDTLLRLLRSPDRAQPIVVVAQDNVPAKDVDVTELTHRLQGVSHVITINPQMVRLLNRELGADRGLQVGDSRVYRPGFSPHDEPSANPRLRRRHSDRGNAYLDRLVREAVRSTRYGADEDSIPTFSNVLVMVAESSHRAAAVIEAPPLAAVLNDVPPANARDLDVALSPASSSAADESLHPSAEVSARPLFAEPLLARLEQLEAALADQRTTSGNQIDAMEHRLQLLQDARDDDAARARDERDRQSLIIEGLREESDRLRRANRDLRVALEDLRAVRHAAYPSEDLVAIPDSFDVLESWANQHLGADIVFTSRALRAARDSDLEDVRPVYESLLMLRDYYLPLLYERTPERVRQFNQRCAELQVEVSKTGEAVNSRRYGDSYRAHYNGEILPLDLHVSGSSSRDTRRGWRIYYHLKSDIGQIVIGHLPEHIRNSLTSS